MFEKDIVKNFYNGQNKKIFHHLYCRYTPLKKKHQTYLITFTKKNTKHFFRITNNFFIEKPWGK